MATKRKVTPTPPPVMTETYRLNSKSSERVFCPANAIEERFYARDCHILPELVTNDGIVHRCEFLGTWNNRGGMYEDEFENICQREYGMSFLSIRSMWIGRLGHVDEFWHLIKLN